jgi:IS605 OrfB family transposase
MLKREKLERLPVKKKWSAIRYNQRTFTPEFGKGFVTLSSVTGRVKLDVNIPKYFHQYNGWKAVAAKLSFNGTKLVLGIVIEERTPSVRPPITILGVDTGILNHAVLSNNKFYASDHIRAVKGRIQYLRGQLQAKGTRSAKRKLKRLSKKEKRFMADVNHQVANWIVAQPFDAIALEKLGIRKGKQLGKRFNRALGNWAFGQLQRFVDYKAESVGKVALYIDARYTSQKCSKCGRIDKKSRIGLRYKCTYCGYELHADLNAARNIANLGTAEAGRLSVNEPNVASSVHNREQLSYKPTI